MAMRQVMVYKSRDESEIDIIASYNSRSHIEWFVHIVTDCKVYSNVCIYIIDPN